MKAIKLEKPWEVACVDMPMPVRKEGEALIRVKAAGICGSDIGAYRGTNGLVSYPRVIGHEIACEVVEIGPNKKGIKAGDRVVVDPTCIAGIAIPAPSAGPTAASTSRCSASMWTAACASTTPIPRTCWSGFPMG